MEGKHSFPSVFRAESCVFFEVISVPVQEISES